MPKIAQSKQFEIRLSKFLKSHKELILKVENILDILRENPFDKRLKTHKLHGKLKGMYSCSITYEYRLVFYFNDEYIYLQSIGNHDDIY